MELDLTRKPKLSFGGLADGAKTAPEGRSIAIPASLMPTPEPAAAKTTTSDAPIEAPLPPKPEPARTQSIPKRADSRPRKLTLRVTARHHDAVRELARERELWTTELFTEIIDRWAKTLEQRGYLGPPEKRRPNGRVDRVLWTVEVPAKQADRLRQLADRIANGDQSRATRELLDREIEAHRHASQTA